MENTQADDDRSKERVTLWKGVWDMIYRGGVRNQDPTFNTSGYQSSYERKLIETDAMTEMVQNTVAHIRELNPGRVLEVGCGTGLLLQRLAPDCEAYWGTDVSAESIKFLQGLGMDPERVHLLHLPADRLQDLPDSSFDTVVINSVIQYFPSADYLLGVLGQLARLLGDRGGIFLGDVRHLGLHKAVLVDVAAYQAGDSLPIAELKETVEERLASERELLFDPRFFSALKREIPAIRCAEVRLKEGDHLNEFTRYRYDVLLYLGDQPCHDDVPSIPATDPALEKRIEKDRPPALRITGVVNTRLDASNEMCGSLDRFATVGELRDWVSKRPPTPGRTPQQWIDWCRDRGYRAILSWVPGGTGGSYEVLLERAGETRKIWDYAPAAAGSNWSEFVNNPLSESAD